MSKFNIIKESDFVKLDMTGMFDFEQTIAALNDILGQLDKDCLDDFLFDLVDSECGLNELDIYKIADEFDNGIRKKSIFRDIIKMVSFYNLKPEELMELSLKNSLTVSLSAKENTDLTVRCEIV